MRYRVPSLLLIAVLGLAANLAQGQFDDPKLPAVEPTTTANSEIRDPAGLFGRDAVREALARLVTIERTYRVPTTIETVESLRNESVDEVALRMAKRLGPQAKGIYILVSKGDRRIEVLVSRENAALNTRARKLAIREAFLDEFKAQNYDAGLRRGVEAIEKNLAAIRTEEKPATVPPPMTTGRISTLDAGTSALLRRNQAKLTLAGAKRVVALAEAKAAEHGYKMNLAVVDDGGHLLAFARMDDARPASGYTAITKATTAATYRQATGPLKGTGTVESPEVLLNLSLQAAASASGGKLTTLLGGVPIVIDGQVIGAIGIGGGTGEQDAEVAKAAVAQFLTEAQASPAAAK
jgi:glc operon protein GlcG